MFPLRPLLALTLLAATAAAAELRPIAVTTPEAWPAKREAILAAVQEIMGPLPGAEKRCPLDVKVESETDEGTYVRRLITYASEPGDRTPAWLLIPKSAAAAKPVAGVLCLHPTNAQIGHDGVVGLGGPANRAYAKELAERGYVTIAPSYPLLAKYNPDVKKLGWASGTMKAVWDHIRALDLLDEMPEVRHGSYGVIGHSLGGHNSIFVAVFDPRIKVVVTSSGFDSFQDYYGGDPARWRPGQGWAQDRYMPRMASYAGKLDQIPVDFHELLAALAPRPVFVNAPLQDSNFKHDSVDRIVAAARPVYALLGHADAIQVVHPDCPHDFPPESREAAYALIDQVLKK
jgi:dienelactone hydrolase